MLLNGGVTGWGMVGEHKGGMCVVFCSGMGFSSTKLCSIINYRIVTAVSQSH